MGRHGPTGCKDVVLLQQSWNQWKASQVSSRNIGGNILFLLSKSHSDTASGVEGVSAERSKAVSHLLVETIDAIVALAGPNLFEEDFERLRTVWIEEKIDPCQVSKVLLDGLRASTAEDIFSDLVLWAWKATVVHLIESWGDHS